MCVPAAFTDEQGQILGAYRINGKSYEANKTMRMRVSLKGDMFFISSKWMGDNGFQHLTLVNNSKAMKFHDKRKSIRRALCKDKDGAFILQSNYPMTMSDFALECGKRCTNATYLDMENLVTDISKMVCLQEHYTFGDTSQETNRPIGYILNRSCESLLQIRAYRVFYRL